MAAARIRHIALVTKDVSKLVRFYATVFGMKVAPGRGTGVYLSDGHVNLAILPLDPERETEGPYLKERIYHFGFQVDDVDSLRPACREQGPSRTSTSARGIARLSTACTIPTETPSTSRFMAGLCSAADSDGAG